MILQIVLLVQPRLESPGGLNGSPSEYGRADGLERLFRQDGHGEMELRGLALGPERRVSNIFGQDGFGVPDFRSRRTVPS